MPTLSEQCDPGKTISRSESLGVLLTAISVAYTLLAVVSHVSEQEKMNPK